MRLSDVDKYQERVRAKLGIVKLDSLDDLIRMLMADGPMHTRNFNPTQGVYIKADDKVKAYMGPAGSGKTTVGVVEVIMKAMLLPGTKWFIARRNYNDLLDTTMKTATKVLGRLPSGTLMERRKMPPEKWYLKPMVRRAGAEEEPSEITFMGLTDSVGSYEFTGGFIDEADEVEEQYVQEMKGRLRYKPYPTYPDENFSIGMAFNPPSMGHWLYPACTGKNEVGDDVMKPWITLYRPSPRENQANLRAGYYEDMLESYPEELRQRLVDGVWGSTFPGKPVIRQFRRHLHVVPHLEYKRGTMFRFMDFGYNHPACLWAQVHRNGGMQVLREYKGAMVEGEAFADLVISKTTEWFPDARNFVDFGDPAVAQHKDTGRMLDTLRKAGIQLAYQRTPFDLSLNLLRKRFEMLIEGLFALQIDESCTMLIDGLSGGYRFKDDGVTPHKGLYDHLIDALRYGCWNIYGNAITTGQKLQTSVSPGHGTKYNVFNKRRNNSVEEFFAAED